jgi:hypothetical protein
MSLNRSIAILPSSTAARSSGPLNGPPAGPQTSVPAANDPRPLHALKSDDTNPWKPRRPFRMSVKRCRLSQARSPLTFGNAHMTAPGSASLTTISHGLIQISLSVRSSTRAST